MKKTILKVVLGVLLLLVIIASAYFLKKYESTVTVSVNYYENKILSNVAKHVGDYKMDGLSENICVIEDESIYEDDLLTADFAGVFKDTTNEVLYVKNAFERLYPASLTKCMTALLVLEQCEDLTQTFVITKDVYADLSDGASLANLEIGASYTIQDLLYALLVPSGNDAANALAIYVAGSQDAFVEMMNARAKELGMNRSHFMNPHGLHNTKHYTCVYDLYLLMHECLKYPMFSSISNTREITIHGKKDGTEFAQSYLSGNSYLRGYTTPPVGISVIGAKTGFTQSAGRCLILLTSDTEKNKYINIVCHASSYDQLYVEMNGLLQIIDQTK